MQKNWGYTNFLKIHPRCNVSKALPPKHSWIYAQLPPWALVFVLFGHCPVWCSRHRKYWQWIDIKFLLYHKDHVPPIIWQRLSSKLVVGIVFFWEQLCIYVMFHDIYISSQYAEANPLTFVKICKMSIYIIHVLGAFNVEHSSLLIIQS